jgi:hypothetical protein
VIDAVGVSSDVTQLLRTSGHPPTDIELALERGWLWRQKIEGVWLYGTTEDAVGLAEQATSETALDVLSAWFLGPMHPLSGYIAKNSTSPSLSKRAVQTLLKRMLRTEKLDAIAVLTNEYQPYIVVVRSDDRSEIDRQIAFVGSRLVEQGQVQPASLLSPTKHRRLHTWREVLLQHAEYLGLGRMESGVLMAWR